MNGRPKRSAAARQPPQAKATEAAPKGAIAMASSKAGAKRRSGGVAGAPRKRPAAGRRPRPAPEAPPTPPRDPPPQPPRKLTEAERARIQWARDQMERAYRVELGLDPPPRKRDGKGGKKGGASAKAEGGAIGAKPNRGPRAAAVAADAGAAAAGEEEALMTDVMSAIEIERQERIAANRRMMADLGLADAVADVAASLAAGEAEKEERRAERKARREAELAERADAGPARRSGRERKTVDRLGEFADFDIEARRDPANARGSGACAYSGAPEGVEVGRLWLSRVHVSADAVHGPWVGGIHGPASKGAYSVVVSGGYEGDVDRGHTFTYTGSGGRDLSGNKRTAPQSRDQQLDGSNLALAVNMWRRLPLRVVRGFKGRNTSAFAPREGYRYDGLYDVTDVWPDIGASGFVTWRYLLTRRDDDSVQAPAPWTRSDWRRAEAEAIAALIEAQGDAPLIPAGTGTTSVGFGKKVKRRRGVVDSRHRALGAGAGGAGTAAFVEEGSGSGSSESE